MKACLREFKSYALRRQKLAATIDRIVTPSAPVDHLDRKKVEAFSMTLIEKLRHGGPVLRRNYLRSVVGRVIVGDKRV